MYDGGDKQSELKPESESSYAVYLQEQLKQHAEDCVLEALHRPLEELAKYQPHVIPETLDGSVRDYGFTIQTLYELKESGLLDAVRLVQVGGQECGLQTSFGYLDIERRDPNHVSLLFRSETGEYSKFTEDNLAEARTSLHELVVNSPLASIYQELSNQVGIGAQSEFSERTVCFAEDPAQFATVLRIFNSYNNFGIPFRLYDLNTKLDVIAEGYLTELIRENAVFDDSGEIIQTRIQLYKGVELILAPTEPVMMGDLMKAKWKMAIKTDPSPYMLEVADQSDESTCEIFFKRPTGRAFLGALTSAGIYFSSSFEDFILTGKSPNFDNRYGGAYTQMTRILAKIIFTGDLDRINSIFMNPKGAPITQEQIAKFVSYQSQDPGFNAFKEVLKQLVENPILDDPRATEEWIQINKGSCFDVTEFWVQAPRQRALEPYQIDGNRFLHKTHGFHTTMNVSPISYKGVTLPRGSLFIRGGDGGLAFLRFTPFMFDNIDDMVSAFGTEVIKSVSHGADPMEVVERMNSLQA